MKIYILLFVMTPLCFSSELTSQNNSQIAEQLEVTTEFEDFGNFEVHFKEKKTKHTAKCEINKTAASVYKKMMQSKRFKDEGVLNSAALLKYLTARLETDLREHHVIFLAALKEKMANDPNTKAAIKHKITVEVLEKLTICAPLNDVDQFEVIQKRKQKIRVKKRRKKHGAIVRPTRLPQVEKEIGSLLKEMENKLLSCHEPALNAQVQEILNEQLYHARCNYDHMQVTLAHMREEIQVGFLDYKYFAEFSPLDHMDDSDEKYLLQILAFENEINRVEEEENFGSYLNLGFKEQLFGALARLDECEKALKFIQEVITSNDSFVTKLCEF